MRRLAKGRVPRGGGSLEESLQDDMPEESLHEDMPEGPLLDNVICRQWGKSLGPWPCLFLFLLPAQ